MLGPGGDGEVVEPDQHPLFGHDEFEVGVFLHGDEGVAVPRQPGHHFLADEGLLGGGHVEHAHGRLEGLQPLVGGLDFVGVGAVDGVAARLQAHAERIAQVVGKQHPALEFGPGEILPALDGGDVHGLLVHEQPHRAPHIGDGQGIALVERLIQRGGIKVAEALDLALVQLGEQVVLRHHFHEVSGRDDQIIPFGPEQFELRVHGLVGFIGGKHHLDACLFREAIDDFLRNVFRPAEHVQFLRLFRKSRRSGDQQRDKRNEEFFHASSL